MKFVDLGAQFREYEDELRAEMDKVFASTAFINGPQVGELEEGLCEYSGAKHSVACASGTDALLLGLMAYDIQPGDEIIVPAFTFIATASMVALYKAVPVFVDVDPISFNIDPEKIQDAISTKTKGIIAVSLYGQCSNMDAINTIAAENNLWVIEDAAQSFGASYKGSMSCTLAEMSTTSFFPAKPLGCFGDGGAVFTENEELAAKLRVLRNHGQVKRYHHQVIGINGRMDTLQAAILKVKLAYFKDEVVMRNQAADRYNAMLDGLVDLPTILDVNTSTWAQYTVRVPNRDSIRQHLADKGIPTAVHYPVPLGQQEAFASSGPKADCPISHSLAAEVLSLPMHAFIRVEEQEMVADALKEALDG